MALAESGVNGGGDANGRVRGAVCAALGLSLFSGAPTVAVEGQRFAVLALMLRASDMPGRRNARANC